MLSVGVYAGTNREPETGGAVEARELETYRVFAKNPDRMPAVRRIAERMGFEFDEDAPDFIVSLGGDGTFLICERRFPGVPKLLVRDSLICFKCCDEPMEELLRMVRRGDGLVEEIMKLRVEAGGERRTATNDAVVRNRDPRHALRFKLQVNGEAVDDLLIGDGIVVATPFGSTGYYSSVTGGTFERGIGVAFNNLTEPRGPLHLDDGAEVTLRVVRGEPYLAVDNHPDMPVLEEDDAATICRARQVARLLTHR